MATRSEVLFFEEGYREPIVFYQHWDGSDLPSIVADALYRADKEGLLQDTPYLGRIIFSEMTRYSDDENSFYGISLSRCNMCSVTVEVYTSYTDKPEIIVNGENYSFDEFISSYLRKKSRAST